MSSFLDCEFEFDPAFAYKPEPLTFDDTNQVDDIFPATLSSTNVPATSTPRGSFDGLEPCGIIGERVRTELSMLYFYHRGEPVAAVVPVRMDHQMDYTAFEKQEMEAGSSPSVDDSTWDHSYAPTAEQLTEQMHQFDGCLSLPLPTVAIGQEDAYGQIVDFPLDTISPHTYVLRQPNIDFDPLVSSSSQPFFERNLGEFVVATKDVFAYQPCGRCGRVHSTPTSQCISPEAVADFFQQAESAISGLLVEGSRTIYDVLDGSASPNFGPLPSVPANLNASGAGLPVALFRTPSPVSWELQPSRAYLSPAPSTPSDSGYESVYTPSRDKTKTKKVANAVLGSPSHTAKASSSLRRQQKHDNATQAVLKQQAGISAPIKLLPTPASTPPRQKKDNVRKPMKPAYYQCYYPGCDKLFDTFHPIKEHVREEHRNAARLGSHERPYRCADPNCGHRTTSVGDAERHMESSTHTEPSHHCGQCGQVYTRTDSLKRHKRRDHGGGRL